jgi:hypothetical protein
MCEKCANVQLREAGRQLFTVYGQHDHSPVLAWSPILLGLLVSAIVALAFCPVPRSQTVSGGTALFLAVAYVAVTVGAGASVLATCGIIAGRHGVEGSVWRTLPRFCGVAAWMTPVVAFSMRNSLWAVSTASVLATLGSGLIYRHHLAISEHEMPLASAEPQITGSSQSTSLMPLALAAFLLQLAALSTVASMVRPAAIFIGSAIFVISFFHKTVTASNQGRSPSRSANPVRLSITAGLAVLLVGASLAPYLELPGEGSSSANAGTSTEQSTAKPAQTSPKPKTGLVQSASSLFRKLLADQPQPRAQGRPADEASRPRPYPALQALFGDGGTATGSESGSMEKKSKDMTATVLVAGDSYTGMILRPEIENHVMIVPPLASRRVFDQKPNERRADPVSIPFYGAYWFFKASERTLPADAVESRGNPASTSFKTTDFTPISMEARQNFGSLIDLSCCRAIELVISNGDRRPGTVAVELILSNTRLPGQPRQSLGILPVNSTQRWFPGDDRPPVAELLSFRLPAQSAIQRFDEAIIHFELRSPRERWSAKIAIEKFRLIPRGL